MRGKAMTRICARLKSQGLALSSLAALDGRAVGKLLVIAERLDRWKRGKSIQIFCRRFHATCQQQSAESLIPTCTARLVTTVSIL